MDELSGKRQERRVREFFQDLASHPFVVVVMTPEGPRLFTKSTDEALLQEAREFLQGEVG